MEARRLRGISIAALTLATLLLAGATGPGCGGSDEADGAVTDGGELSAVTDSAAEQGPTETGPDRAEGMPDPGPAEVPADRGVPGEFPSEKTPCLPDRTCGDAGPADGPVDAPPDAPVDAPVDGGQREEVPDPGVEQAPDKLVVESPPEPTPELTPRGFVKLAMTHTGTKPLYFQAEWGKSRIARIQRSNGTPWQTITNIRGCGMCDCATVCPHGCPVCGAPLPAVWEVKQGDRYEWTWTLTWFEGSSKTCSDGSSRSCYSEKPVGLGAYRFQLCFSDGYSPTSAKRDSSDPSRILMAHVSGKQVCKTVQFKLPDDDGRTLSVTIP